VGAAIAIGAVVGLARDIVVVFNVAFGMLAARFDYPLFATSPGGRRRPLRLAGCTVGVRFASTLGERDFPAPTLGRCMGVPT
jgi:hypothetical protein